ASPSRSPPLGSPPDPETGSVIINNAIGIKDASDFDEGLSARRAGVIKVIQMPPAAWIVWVRPQLEITAITYSGRMEEEEPEESPFFHVRQRVVLYARVWSDGVASPSVTWGALVDNHDHKLEDHSWGPSGFTGPYIGNFDQKYIPKLFPPGTWVAVEVGVKLRNHFIVDDFILKSIMNVNIAIKKIGIKLTGL
ncbi:MAG: hypothetical protein HYU47_07695, partial [Deltaproteobacteria bacterium]|nr:hypothetical protein [Deltaproteobacteria bacterium]